MKLMLSLVIIASCLFWIAQRRAQMRADRRREAEARQQRQAAFQQEMDALNLHLKDKP